jgi:YihY family inner membrane protein
MAALVVISSFAAPLSALAHNFGQQFIPKTFATVLENLAMGIVGVVSTFTLFFLVYRYLSHRLVPAISAIVGASTATLLWECARIGFTYYLTRFPGIGLLYGAYTFIVVTALWIYYSALVLVVGGILTKLHWDRLFEQADTKSS